MKKTCYHLLFVTLFHIFIGLKMLLISKRRTHFPFTKSILNNGTSEQQSRLPLSNISYKSLLLQKCFPKVLFHYLSSFIGSPYIYSAVLSFLIACFFVETLWRNLLLEFIFKLFRWFVPNILLAIVTCSISELDFFGNRRGCNLL